MSKVGLEWYKREPLAYLGDVQGLNAREHAVYSIVLDLIYLHGGSVNDDPGWISGWIKDMGAAAVRNIIGSLVARGTLTLDGDQITQKRAKNEAKTKQKHRENAAENGKKGGEKSAEIRAALKENKDLSEPNASAEIQAEKRREEKSTEPNGSDGQAVADLTREAVWKRGVPFLCENGVKEQHARSVIGKWLKASSADEVFAAFKQAREAGTGDPVSYITEILKPDVRIRVSDILKQTAEATRRAK